MNVVHVSPTFYSSNSVIGGGEKYIIYMIRSLNIGAEKSNLPIVNSILSFGENAGNHVLGGDICCRVIKGSPWDPYSIKIDEFIHQTREADVVVVHQCLSSVGLFLASHSQLDGKYVVGMDHGGGEYRLVSHTHEGVGMYNAFWAQSEFASNAFAGFGVQTTIVRGPVDTEYYQPDPLTEKDPSLVVSVGRLLPHKGFDRVIKAMPAELKLVIAGGRSDEDYYRYLKELQFKSDAAVEIRENLNDVEIRALLQRASLFVHASTHIDYRGRYYAKPELLGLAPLEALACGTPTLVSTAGSLNELTVVEGAQSFGSDDQLASTLSSHVRNREAYPSPNEIHASVEALYGPTQFGFFLYAELMARNKNQ